MVTGGERYTIATWFHSGDGATVRRQAANSAIRPLPSAIPTLSTPWTEPLSSTCLNTSGSRAPRLSCRYKNLYDWKAW